MRNAAMARMRATPQTQPTTTPAISPPLRPVPLRLLLLASSGGADGVATAGAEVGAGVDDGSIVWKMVVACGWPLPAVIVVLSSDVVGASTGGVVEEALGSKVEVAKVEDDEEEEEEEEDEDEDEVEVEVDVDGSNVLEGACRPISR